MGAHLFGCDDCQTVCPFNASGRAAEGTRAPAPFRPHARWADVAPEDLLALDEAGWSRISEGSPVHRATREGLARNAAILLGNRGDAAALPALERAAASHDSPVVRDAARWALARIRANHVRK
jgi:epoxyqueuosine reductase